MARQIKAGLKTEQAKKLTQFLDGMKRRNTYATLGQVKAAYVGVEPTKGTREHTAWKTRRRNMHCLSNIVRQSLPGDPLKHSTSVLTYDQRMEWMAIRQRYYTLTKEAEELEEDGDDEGAKTLRAQAEPEALQAAGPWRKHLTLGAHDANTTLRSMLGQASDIFCEDSLKVRLFDLTLPDLQPWLEAPLPKAMPAGYVPVPQAIITDLHQSAKQLKKDSLKVWKANRLVCLHALRAGEVVAARGSWLIHDEKGWAIELIDRPEEGFYLKSATRRLLPLDPELAEAIKDTAPDASLIGALTPTEAYNLVNREHNTWLRRFIPDRVKGNHEMRKHAGSVVYTQHGLEAARAYLGHKSQNTTEKWYTSLLKDMPTMTSAAMDLPAMRTGKGKTAA